MFKIYTERLIDPSRFIYLISRFNHSSLGCNTNLYFIHTHTHIFQRVPKKITFGRPNRGGRLFYVHYEIKDFFFSSKKRPRIAQTHDVV